MRKVTAHVAAAFAVRKPIRIKATVCDGSAVTLHGNVIASHNGTDGSVTLTLAGWGTTTTRERVNGIARALWGTRAPRFWQQDHAQHVTDWTGRGGAIDPDDSLRFDTEGRLVGWYDKRGKTRWNAAA